GDDTFLVNGNDGSFDRYQGDAGYDVILGGAGDDSIRMETYSGVFTVEKIDGGLGINLIKGDAYYGSTIDLSGTELVNIARIEGGASLDTITGSAGNDVIDGKANSDTLAGGAGDDTFLVNGNDGSFDRYQGDAGYDVILGGAGDDTIRVRTFSGVSTVEKIDGGLGINVIKGDYEWGSTVDLSNTLLVNIARVEGGVNMDTITGSAGNDVIDSGMAADVLCAGAGDDWVAGGKGNDTLDGGLGSNLFAFNRGDGADTINNSTWGNDIVSLGGGIAYASLKLIKTGSDLVLDAGAGDRLSLKNWYVNPQNHGIGRLQVVTVGGDYDAASSDITRNKQVELFDFARLVQNFDAAVAANSTVATTGWNVMNNLLDAHLSASDTQALGGDLSFQYATSGNLVGVGLVATPTELQTLKPHA
ncbi:MAG: calcium-binding protein, partial [Rhodoferax sp.]|nr:calcium-binding protein [Rhodoferax sp.]